VESESESKVHTVPLAPSLALSSSSPDAPVSSRKISGRSDCRQCLKRAYIYAHATCWAIAALVGVVMFWLGIWNIAERYIFHGKWYGETLCIVIGMLLILLTNNFGDALGLQQPASNDIGDTVNRNAVPTVAALNSDSHSKTAGTNGSGIRAMATESGRCVGCCALSMVYIRATLSLSGVVMVWKGVWNLLDLHLTFEPLLLRELLYVFLGLGCLLLTRTLLPNAGVASSPATERCERQAHLREAEYDREIDGGYSAVVSVLELIGNRGVRRSEQPSGAAKRRLDNGGL